MHVEEENMRRRRCSMAWSASYLLVWEKDLPSKVRMYSYTCEGIFFNLSLPRGDYLAGEYPPELQYSIPRGGWRRHTGDIITLQTKTNAYDTPIIIRHCNA